jgi:hypothetical protein
MSPDWKLSLNSCVPGLGDGIGLGVGIGVGKGVVVGTGDGVGDGATVGVGVVVGVGFDVGLGLAVAVGAGVWVGVEGGVGVVEGFGVVDGVDSGVALGIAVGSGVGSGSLRNQLNGKPMCINAGINASMCGVGAGREFGEVVVDSVPSVFAFDPGLERKAVNPTTIIIVMIAKAIIETDLLLFIKYLLNSNTKNMKLRSELLLACTLILSTFVYYPM